MKKAVLTAMVISALMAGGVGGFLGDTANQKECADSAGEELRKVFSDEISAFFKSDDLSKTLGIDSSGQAGLEESVRTYISRYSMDEEKLGEAKASLDTLLQNAEGLSVEELQDRIEGIFKE